MRSSEWTPNFEWMHKHQVGKEKSKQINKRTILYQSWICASISNSLLLHCVLQIWNVCMYALVHDWDQGQIPIQVKSLDCPRKRMLILIRTTRETSKIAGHLSERASRRVDACYPPIKTVVAHHSKQTKRVERHAILANRKCLQVCIFFKQPIAVWNEILLLSFVF